MMVIGKSCKGGWMTIKAGNVALIDQCYYFTAQRSETAVTNVGATTTISGGFQPGVVLQEDVSQILLMW